MSGDTLPPKLREIVDDFAFAQGREKLEILLQYAESLPPLPERYRGKHEILEAVPECMTPVFIAVERDEEGRLHFYFDIPPNAPTVRGLASILYHGLDGATPEEVLAVPSDFFYETGLQEAISHQRMHGFAGILARMKRLAARVLEKAS